MVTNKNEMSGIERLEAMLDAGRPTEEETAAQREFKRRRYEEAVERVTSHAADAGDVALFVDKTTGSWLFFEEADWVLLYETVRFATNAAYLMHDRHFRDDPDVSLWFASLPDSVEADAAGCRFTAYVPDHDAIIVDPVAMIRSEADEDALAFAEVRMQLLHRWRVLHNGLYDGHEEPLPVVGAVLDRDTADEIDEGVLIPLDTWRMALEKSSVSRRTVRVGTDEARRALSI